MRVIVLGDNRITSKRTIRTRAGELRDGKVVQTSSGRELYISQLDGLPVITYVDENQVGYVFLSQDLSERALRELVFSSDLIDRARGGR